MSTERLNSLLRRLRRWYRHSPYIVDEWLQEVAAEGDDAQWARVCKVMGWR